MLVELRSRSPMLDLGFFRNRTFMGANTVGLLVSFGFFGILFFLALFMQNVLGYSATGAGIRQLPTTLTVMVAAIASGRIVGRIGARAPITVGMILLGTAILLFTTVQSTSTYSSFWWMLVIMGLGNGLVMSPITTAVMSTVPARRAGMASATSNTMRQVGGVFGIAVLGAVVTSRFSAQLTQALAKLKLPPAVADSIATVAHRGQESVSLPSLPGLDVSQIRQAIFDSFTSGLHLGLWICGAVVLLGAAVSFVFIRGTSPAAQWARREAETRTVEAQAAPLYAEPTIEATSCIEAAGQTDFSRSTVSNL
ncbi:MAG: MFS transporter [Thermoleophilia bacterium]|nr:MFS transporter [Thermoleophilia bacterium]